MTATLCPSRHSPRAARQSSGRVGAAAPTIRQHRARAERSTAAHDYVLRRTVAAVVAVALVALVVVAASAVIGALADVGGRPAAASDIGPTSIGAPIVRVHVAQAGDTLWSIAAQYRGGLAQSRFVDALIDLNGGTAIQVGQAVRLP